MSREFFPHCPLSRRALEPSLKGPARHSLTVGLLGDKRHETMRVKRRDATLGIGIVVVAV